MGAFTPKHFRLYFLPVRTRVPLKFGAETLTQVTCARVSVEGVDDLGTPSTGWGETPLSVQWVWPGDLPYAEREEQLKAFCRLLGRKLEDTPRTDHPLAWGVDVQQTLLPEVLKQVNADREHPMPWLAGLVCLSAFDIAVHDAYAMARNVPVYQIYNAEHMSRDLSSFLEPAEGSGISFKGVYPGDFFQPAPQSSLPAWHLVGGKDALEKEDLTGDEPDDGYPVTLDNWIETDGLFCLKVKLTGTDRDWDLDRLRRVGRLAVKGGVDWISTDFNCTVHEPAYVTGILDELLRRDADLYRRILYVEQPFPYELEDHPIDVHCVAARKPLFMDESAHDWRQVRLGRSLGWTGVALKTCKTQTGALLSACWARAHGMTLMVQDLTNPMLAQIPHVQLAWHIGTIMGVETNAMQFYPDVSAPEARVHPGLYRRRNGRVDAASVLDAPGFGYRTGDIHRTLPAEEPLS